jgi:hypothetical protein
MPQVPQPNRNPRKEEMHRLHSVQERKAQKNAARFRVILYECLAAGILLASVAGFAWIALHLIRLLLR